MQESYLTLFYEGRKVTLTQQPYIDLLIMPNRPQRTVYIAHAKDEEENEYRVIWYPKYTEDGNLYEDEEDICDWESPDDMILL